MAQFPKYPSHFNIPPLLSPNVSYKGFWISRSHLLLFPRIKGIPTTAVWAGVIPLPIHGDYLTYFFGPSGGLRVPFALPVGLAGFLAILLLQWKHSNQDIVFIEFYQSRLKPFVRNQDLTLPGIKAFLSNLKCGSAKRAYFRAIKAFCNWS